MFGGSIMFINFGQVLTNIQKQEIEMILNRRDKIMTIGNGVIDNAVNTFKVTAPRNTGQLSGSVKKSKIGRNTVMLVVPKGPGARGNLVNILNNSKTRNRRSAGFYDRIELNARNRFTSKATNIR